MTHAERFTQEMGRRTVFLLGRSNARELLQLFEQWITPRIQNQTRCLVASEEAERRKAAREGVEA